MNAILPGTIEEPGLDKYKVGTLEAPSGGAWFEAVLFTLHWLDGRGEPSPHWLRAQELNIISAAAARSGTPNEPLGSNPHGAFRTF